MNNSTTTTSLWFTAPAPRVAAGREPQYIEFEENWMRELAPQCPLETEAAQDFIRSAWRKREVIEAQNQLDVSLADEGPNARKFDRLLRYEKEFESRCNRALDRLRKLQSGRNRKPAKPVSILETFPDETARLLYTLDIETRHLNAHLRARKAGVIDPSSAPYRAVEPPPKQ